MRNTNKADSPLGVGIITIFMVLIILCLSIFAALTFFSAKADLKLSKINADTISAYYQADVSATKTASQFIQSNKKELKQIFPMTDMQSLYIHLLRQADGTVSILSWQTISIDKITKQNNSLLPIWNGQ